MIKNQWYVVLDSNEVKSHPIGVTRLGEKMVFWRDTSGKISAAVDQCPHRGVALSVGKILSDQLQCPFHGFEFDSSGKCTLIPANGQRGVIPKAMHLKTYPTYEDHGFIWLWWGNNVPPELPDPEFFDNLNETFYFGSAHDSWNTHYSRVIENQLDVVHLPFIHRNTIGRGNRTVIDGPVVEWKNDQKFYVYVFNRMDDGVPPRKPHELASKDPTSFHLEFIFPNLWQNFISENIRILAAFVPVDQEHTLLYLRFYQNFLSFPLIGHIVARLSMPSNIFIAHEDRRIVVTQAPKESGLKIGEVLIQGDFPIIEYRKKRAALQKMSENN